MQPPDLIVLFVTPLNTLGLPYMITGAVAAVMYGEPRMTRDLDVVVDLRAPDAARLAAAFPSDEFYLPPVQIVTDEARRARDGHFNVIHHTTALKADFYLAGEDPLHAWALERRVKRDVGAIPVWFAPPEYVVVRKLDWFRLSASAKHLADARAVLAVSDDLVNRVELAAWVERLGLAREWSLVTNVPPGGAPGGTR